MDKQHYHEDEQQFIDEIRLDKLQLEDFIAVQPTVAHGTLESIRRRTHAKLGALSNATPRPTSTHPRRWSVWLSAAAAVICALMVGTATFLWPGDVVHAMEQAMLQLSSYHGVIETTVVSRETGQPLQEKVSQTEIWWSRGRYRIRQDQALSISDGEYTWHVHDQYKMADRQLDAADYGVESFTLQAAADLAKLYPYAVTGLETVAGRESTKLTVTLPDGLPTYIWIDNETKLPIQIQRLSGPAVQTTTFVNLEINPTIPDDQFQFQPPTDYKVSRLTYQTPSTFVEAATYAGFTPLQPKDSPRNIYAISGEVVLDYGDVKMIQLHHPGADEKVDGSFPQGSVNGRPLLVGPRSLEWHQDEIDIRIVGETQRTTALARQIAPTLSLPDPNLDLVGKAQVKLPTDLGAAKQLQLQQDYRSPGISFNTARQVANWFANGQPADHTVLAKDPQVPFSKMRVVADTGAQAVVESVVGPYARVYLQRLVRQDYSGVWSIVGYDLR